MERTRSQSITIETIRHRDTGLIVATSPEMKGLIVHARSEKELNVRIPQAIRAILEAEGVRVVDVKPAEVEKETKTPAGFVPSRQTFEAIAA